MFRYEDNEEVIKNATIKCIFESSGVRPMYGKFYVKGDMTSRAEMEIVIRYSKFEKARSIFLVYNPQKGWMYKSNTDKVNFRYLISGGKPISTPEIQEYINSCFNKFQKNKPNYWEMFS